jgi:toxin CptA
VQFPILIGLHRSRFLDIGVLAVTLVANAVVLVFPLSEVSPWALLPALWIVASIAWQKLSPKLSAIRLERDGRVLIRRVGESEFFVAELLPGVTVHPWLTIVKLKTEAGDAFFLIATVDSINRENFRRFRMFLRWQVNFSAANDDA